MVTYYGLLTIVVIPYTINTINTIHQLGITIGHAGEAGVPAHPHPHPRAHSVVHASVAAFRWEHRRAGNHKGSREWHS